MLRVKYFPCLLSFHTCNILQFWQVEIASDPTSGAPIKWGTVIRLRHVATQRYLVKDARGRLTLVSNYLESGVSGLFRLHAVIKEQGFVQNRSYTRIELESADVNVGE